MNIETIREYCLSLPQVTEDMAFGEDYLLFRVHNKIFGCMPMQHNEWFTVKCDPDYAIDLRDRHQEIEPAWHWNKKYWNQLNITGTLTDDFIKSLIRHSYAEVVKKLPRRLIAANPDIAAIH